MPSKQAGSGWATVPVTSSPVLCLEVCTPGYLPDYLESFTNKNKQQTKPTELGTIRRNSSFCNPGTRKFHWLDVSIWRRYSHTAQGHFWKLHRQAQGEARNPSLLYFLLHVPVTWLPGHSYISIECRKDVPRKSPACYDCMFNPSLSKFLAACQKEKGNNSFMKHVFLKNTY